MFQHAGFHRLAPLLGALVLVLAPLLSVARPQPTIAAGVVSECTEAALRNALAGGGYISFSCSGVIKLAGQLEITQNTIIDGDGQVTLDGQYQTRLITIDSGVSVNLVELALANGSLSLTGGTGGAIDNYGTLGILNSTVTGSSALDAGAIINRIGATLVIGESTLSGNGATVSGGAIVNSGNLTIVASTVTGNRSRFAPALDNTSYGTATIAASTFSGNSSSDDPGGAIFNDGQLTVNASTLANNTGGAIYNNIGAVQLTANILSGANVCGGPNAIGSKGYNVVSDGTCNLTAAGDLQNANPLLGPLMNNGGPTETFMPQPGSPAIGRVPNGVCLNLGVLSNGFDQRGAQRPKSLGASCDSGSAETGANVQVQVHGVHVSPAVLDEGGHATISVAASGPADDALHYTFGCPDGAVGPQPAPVAECFFAEPGEYAVPVTVSEAARPDNSDDESAAVTVHNLAPVIERVSIYQDRSLVAVHVEAADPGGGELRYRFDCAGTIIGPWAAPEVLCDVGDQTGELTIQVEVSDAQQASASYSVVVELPTSICGWRVQRPPPPPDEAGWTCAP